MAISIWKKQDFGDDGKWVGYTLEKTGRDYNSKEVNNMSDKRKKGDNSEFISENYERLEKSGFKEDGLAMNELDPRKTVERLMDEGYNKKEAVQVINYMIGPDELSEDEAKQKVNEQIEEKAKEQERGGDEKVPWERAVGRRGY